MAKKRATGGGIEETIWKIVESAKGPAFYMGPDGNFIRGNKPYDKVRPAVRAQVFQKQAEAEKLLRLAVKGTPVSRLGKIEGENYLLTLTPVISGKKDKYFLLGTLANQSTGEDLYHKAPDSQYLLRTMAHEIKTPLSNIFLTLDMLINECAAKHKDENKLKMLQRLKRQSFQLMELIDNFLDMARSKEGMFEPFVEKFEIRDLVEEIDDTIAPFAAGKGLDWSVKIERGVLSELESDPEMIKRVLLNLLSNSCKFTEKGKVSLSVKNRPKSVVFEISDSGCGIDEKEIETIFHPFIRGSVLGPRASGFGLGLSIARMFVEALRGKIEVESEVGRGSKFTLILPVRHNGEKT